MGFLVYRHQSRYNGIFKLNRCNPIDKEVTEALLMKTMEDHQAAEETDDIITDLEQALGVKIPEEYNKNADGVILDYEI